MDEQNVIYILTKGERGHKAGSFYNALLEAILNADEAWGAGPEGEPQAVGAALVRVYRLADGHNRERLSNVIAGLAYQFMRYDAGITDAAGLARTLQAGAKWVKVKLLDGFPECEVAIRDARAILANDEPLAEAERAAGAADESDGPYQGPGLISAARAALELIQRDIAEQGGCDHEVGICACGDIAVADNLEAAIANFEKVKEVLFS